jgi:serine/threonine protein phosphatase 1
VWNPLAQIAQKSPASIPKGVRIYAIGDVHGCAELLTQLLQRIDNDLTAHPVARPLHVFLGDYVDRGPQSREVLDLVIERSQCHRSICLKGNHESYLQRFLARPSAFPVWKDIGGLHTLMSYGITPSINATDAEQERLAVAFNQALPESHQRFLGRLALSFTCGDYFFVHAGVRPGVRLDLQSQRDLLWIREDFLLCEDDFDKIIVHGHTPVYEPDVRSNRINIDTGAYATGQLTCLVLEGTEISFL